MHLFSFTGLLLYNIATIIAISPQDKRTGTVQHKASQECDMRNDVMLVEDADPANKHRTFLQCRPAGRGMVGVWQRMLCPPGEVFYIDRQLCDTPEPNSASQEARVDPGTAYVNQSCARGERCIGGTYCETEYMRCLCPYGTVPVARPQIYRCEKDMKLSRKAVSRKVVYYNKASPGESCLDNEVCTGNSFCVPDTGVCSCPDGTTLQHNNCMRLVTQQVAASPGGRCDRFTECTDGSVCMQGRCRCRHNMVRQGNTCVEKDNSDVGPGENCAHGQHCIRGSVCSSVTKRCMCPIGTTQSGEECVDNKLVPANRSGVGRECELNTDCIIGAYCNANTYPPLCQCLSTHVEINHICYRIIYPGQSGCDFGRQCAAAFEGASCVNQMCACPRGMNAQGETCEPEYAAPGEPCEAFGISCIGGSHCYNSACVCPYGFTTLFNWCLKNTGTKLVQRHECVDDLDCIKNGYCRNGLCLCHGNSSSNCSPLSNSTRHKFSSGRIDDQAMSFRSLHNNEIETVLPFSDKFVHKRIEAADLLGVPLGFFCLPEQLICANGNGTCLNGLCKCPLGFFQEDGACLPVIAGPEGSCSSGQRCGGGSICKDGVCKCPGPGYTAHDGRCVRMSKKRVNESCIRNKECPQNALCVNRVCKCSNGSRPNGDECRLVFHAQIGASCTPSNGCTGGASCINNRCHCSEGSLENQNRCEQYPGGSCANAQICIKGSNCQFGVCKCASGQQLIRNECVPGSSFPGDSCQNGEICIGGSTCIFGACLCPASQIIDGNSCKNQQDSSTAADPGENCLGSKVCIGGSFCSNGTCRCPNFQMIQDRQCITVPAFPGDSCSTGHKCTGGSFCNGTLCTCPMGAVISGRLCQTAVPSANPTPGERCRSGLECSGGATCQRQLCRCPLGQTIDSTLKICKPTFGPKNPFDACNNNNGDGCLRETLCINGVCSCPNDQALVSNECIPISGSIALPGESCANFETCYGGSQCSNSVCSCPNPLIISGNQCINQPFQGHNPGDTCSSIDICSGGSFCLNNICQCRSGQVLISETCAPGFVPPGATCQLAQQCTSGALCTRGLCQCQNGYTIRNMTCTLMLGKPNESCNQQRGCTGGAICGYDNVCRCPAGLIVAGETCFEAFAEPGSSCSNRQQCTGGSICSNSGTCVCPTPDLIYNKQCIPALSEPGETCFPVQRCTGGSECVNNLCKCPEGQLIRNKQCLYIRPANPGQVCFDRQLCTGGASCINGSCQCPTGYTIRDQVCAQLDLPGPGESCRLSKQCSGGAFCDAAIQYCECPTGTTIKGGLCLLNDQGIIPVNPGGICGTARFCIGGSFCGSSRLCECPGGKVANDDVCVNAGAELSGPGDTCSQGQICTGGSICRSRFCVCQSPLVAFNGICQVQDQLPTKLPSSPQSSLPGDSCALGQDCAGDSYCQNGLCVCHMGFIIVENRCYDYRITRTPGEACTLDTICTGGSNCLNSICKCRDDETLRNNRCEPRIQNSEPGELCDVDKVCSGNSICQGSRCICRPGDILVEKECMSRALPGEPCSSGEFCTGGSSCNGSACECPVGTVSAANLCLPRVSVSYPGGTCFHGELCIGGSICKRSACVCPPGLNVINEECHYPRKQTPNGGYCSITNHCMTGLMCMFGICKCIASDTSLCQGGAMMMSPPGGSCAALQNCSGGSICRDGWCVCPSPDMVVTKGKCITSGSRHLQSVSRSQPITHNQPIVQEVSAPTESALPGEYCNDRVFCLGGSICSEHECKCLKGMRIDGGRCVKVRSSSTPQRRPQPGPYEGCEHRGSRCAGGAICDGMLCQCPPGTQLRNGICREYATQPSNHKYQGQGQGQGQQQGQGQNSGQQQQISKPTTNSKTSPPYGECSGGQICLGNSYCDGNYCRCRNDDLLVNEHCVRKGQVLSSIPYTVESANAKSNNQQGELNNHQQISSNNQYKSQIPQQVHQKIQSNPGGPCINGEECIGGSRCDGRMGQCICAPGMEILNNQCVYRPPSYAQPGARCDRGEECTGGSRCQSNDVCTCPTGTDADRNGVCQRNVPQIQPQQIPQPQPRPQPQPKQPVNNQRSKNNNWNPEPLIPIQPIVPFESVPSGNNFPYTPFREVRERTREVDTTVDNIPDGSIPLGQGKCIRSSMCKSNAICMNNVCRCKPGMIENAGACVDLQGPTHLYVDINERCSSTDYCLQESRCINGVCRCPQGTKFDGNHCAAVFRISEESRKQFQQQYLQPGSLCSGESQCGGFSKCDPATGVCTCVPGRVLRGGQCIEVSHHPSVLLVDPESISYPGEECLVFEDCVGDAYCRMGFCVCPYGTTSRNRQCIRDPTYKAPVMSSPGYTCTKGEICTGNSRCVDGICDCPAGMVPSNGVCVPANSVNKSTTNTRPNQNRLQVPFPTHGQKPRVNPTPAPGQKCYQHQLCSGGAICSMGFCKCPVGRHNINGVCAAVNPQQQKFLPTFTPLRNVQQQTNTQNIFGFQKNQQNTIQQKEENRNWNGNQRPFYEYNNKNNENANNFLPLNIPNQRNQPLKPGATSSGKQYPDQNPFQPQITQTKPQNGNSFQQIPQQQTNNVFQPNQPSQIMPNHNVRPGYPCNITSICTGGSICTHGFCRCHNDQIIGDVCLGFTSNTLLTPIPSQHLSTPAPMPPMNSNHQSEVSKNQRQLEISRILRPVILNSDEEFKLLRTYNPFVAKRNSDVVAISLKDDPLIAEQCAYDVPVEDVSMKNVPIQNVPMKHISINHVSMDYDSMKHVPMKHVPVKHVPMKHVPMDYVAMKDVSMKNISMENVLVKNVPMKNVPVKNVPRNGVPVKDIATHDISMNYVPLEDAPKKEPVLYSQAEPGGDCNKAIACTKGSVCMNSVCVCPEKHKIIHDRCAKIVPYKEIAPGKTCDRSSRCAGGTTCIAHVCRCPLATNLVNGVCRRREGVLVRNKRATFHINPRRRTAQAGEDCGTGVTCLGGAYCSSSGKCLCPPALFVHEGVCRLRPFKQPEPVAVPVTPEQLYTSCPLPAQQHLCQLPACYCSKTGTDIPGGLSFVDTPQLVVLTFDDAVNGKTMPIYKELLGGDDWKNPNGCPVKATIFVSHEWTNYDNVMWLYSKDHELASNSISHQQLGQKDFNRWMSEMDGQRQIMVKFANVDERDVTGMRAPLTESGGDKMFDMMEMAGFDWDNTLSADPGKDGAPYWPQTLDYKPSWSCHGNPCPRKSHPGIWSIPLNQFYGYYIPEYGHYKRANMVKAALALNETADSILQLLRQNFERAYTTNKAPYILTLNADMMNSAQTGQGGMIALKTFLSELERKPDVYMVTMHEMLEWIKQPTPLNQLEYFEPFQCFKADGSRKKPSRKQSCSKPNKCIYRTPDLNSQEHVFQTCGECPTQYPWLSNPLGNQEYKN